MRAGDEPVLLSTTQMASFVARGFLRFDGVVPPDINEQAMDERCRAEPDPDRDARAGTLFLDDAVDQT